ncbi:hypothetical protein AMECASPLE_009003 [Ameca splendens]|uniref:Uncharacterized protein n=1 Tax=Ameca splendens TaxID=208324 RepID=A0ABV0XP12_9TELE
MLVYAPSEIKAVPTEHNPAVQTGLITSDPPLPNTTTRVLTAEWVDAQPRGSMCLHSAEGRTTTPVGSYHHLPHNSQGLTPPHGAIVSPECCSLALFSPLQLVGKGCTVRGLGLVWTAGDPSAKHQL